MKQRSTTPVATSLTARAVIALAVVLVAIATPIQLSTVAKADRYDDQINAIQKEVDQYQAAARDLAGKADTLQRELNRLSNEKAQLQAQIDLSQAKYDKLVSDIAANEAKIAANRKALGEIIADLYIDGKVSALEMLASSSNIGDYVDKQSYRESISDKLSSTINEIKALKKKLESDKKDVELVLSDQKTQRDALAAKENEQATLVAQTKGEEAAYQNLSAAKSKDIASLRAAQVAANARFIGGGSYAAGNGPACGGGYPGKWCNIPMDSTVDDWGMYNRECVSYTAFKVAQSGRNMPYWGGIGNANQWDDNARSQGIPVDYSPRAGDVAVSNAGQYGHVMYVESVNGNGTINISQYNADWRGTYSTNTISASGLVFIHF